MKGNVLVIDESGATNPALDLLSRAGFRCFHARGPLRVRSLLAAEAIDLIIWREQGGNPELTRDLAQEWGARPEIPVVHLYPNEAAAGRFVPGSVREALPAESVETMLLPAVQRLLGAAEAPGRLRHTELAFRNVVSRMRATLLPSAPDKLPVPRPGSLDGPSTALDPVERELLFAAGTASGRAKGPLRRFLSRFRPGTP